MKFTVNCEALLAALQKVLSVVDNRATNAILSNALLEADSAGTLTLTATDNTLTVRTTIPADVAEAGATTLPVKRLFSVSRELSAQEVEITVDTNDIASLHAENSFFKIHGISRADYPEIQDLTNARSYVISQATLRSMLRLTSYAACLDASRQVLNTVLLSFHEGKLSVVATDSRRLALVEQELPFDPANEANLVVPLKTVDELLRILGDDGDLKILATPSQAAFEFDGTLILSKLVDKTYPNYRQVLPTASGNRVTLDREPFLTALRRTHQLVADATSSVRLNFSQDHLEVLTYAEGIGEGRETIAVRYAGPDLSISFNPLFLMDPLKNLSTDEVFLDVLDDASPGVVRSTINFIYVLMPIRI